MGTAEGVAAPRGSEFWIFRNRISDGAVVGGVGVGGPVLSERWRQGKGCEGNEGMGDARLDLR